MSGVAKVSGKCTCVISTRRDDDDVAGETEIPNFPFSSREKSSSPYACPVVSRNNIRKSRARKTPFGAFLSIPTYPSRQPSKPHPRSYCTYTTLYIYTTLAMIVRITTENARHYTYAVYTGPCNWCCRNENVSFQRGVRLHFFFADVAVRVTRVIIYCDAQVYHKSNEYLYGISG